MLALIIAASTTFLAGRATAAGTGCEVGWRRAWPVSRRRRRRHGRGPLARARLVPRRRQAEGLAGGHGASQPRAPEVPKVGVGPEREPLPTPGPRCRAQVRPWPSAHHRPGSQQAKGASRRKLGAGRGTECCRKPQARSQTRADSTRAQGQLPDSQKNQQGEGPGLRAHLGDGDLGVAELLRELPLVQEASRCAGGVRRGVPPPLPQARRRLARGHGVRTGRPTARGGNRRSRDARRRGLPAPWCCACRGTAPGPREREAASARSNRDARRIHPPPRPTRQERTAQPSQGSGDAPAGSPRPVVTVAMMCVALLLHRPRSSCLVVSSKYAHSGLTRTYEYLGVMLRGN